jgi:hypothetical protein
VVVSSSWLSREIRVIKGDWDIIQLKESNYYLIDHELEDDILSAKCALLA